MPPKLWRNLTTLIDKISRNLFSEQRIMRDFVKSQIFDVSCYHPLLDLIGWISCWIKLKLFYTYVIYKFNNMSNVFKEYQHNEHLPNVFKRAQQYNMKFNLEKWTFKVGSKKFLDFYITMRGIKVNPNEWNAVIKIEVRTMKNGIMK